ncbi:YfgM family protein [Sulfuriflexus sp.]|uniref:YfgM family protein n=1 Tax=Sulfuriflexus sp. TaxID=2015443 RepID=UPI0028CF6B28|nr:tetratricopeptide repeat protein [Sulfuriflexus sp.]MDT8404067.1 tetratricopeptide repeat protein [Sulfuriflexus sp.]
MAEHLTEEQQVEAIKTWWKENGIAVVAGLIIGFGALFGWRYYLDYRETQSIEASGIYESMQQKFKLGQADDASLLASQIISDYPRTPYATMAALAAAKQAAVKMNMQQARKQLQWVLDNGRQPQLLHTARLQLAAIMLNAAEYDAALGLIAAAGPGGYAGLYEEIKGDVLLARGERNAAHEAYDRALQAEGLGAQQRQVVQMKFDDTRPSMSIADAGVEK